MSKFRKNPELMAFTDKLAIQLTEICGRRNVGFFLMVSETKPTDGKLASEIGSNIPDRKMVASMLTDVIAAIRSSEVGGGNQ